MTVPFLVLVATELHHEHFNCRDIKVHEPWQKVRQKNLSHIVLYSLFGYKTKKKNINLTHYPASNVKANSFKNIIYQKTIEIMNKITFVNVFDASIETKAFAQYVDQLIIRRNVLFQV